VEEKKVQGNEISDMIWHLFIQIHP